MTHLTTIAFKILQLSSAVRDGIPTVLHTARDDSVQLMPSVARTTKRNVWGSVPCDATHCRKACLPFNCSRLLKRKAPITEKRSFKEADTCPVSRQTMHRSTNYLLKTTMAPIWQHMHVRVSQDYMR